MIIKNIGRKQKLISYFVLVASITLIYTSLMFTINYKHNFSGFNIKSKLSVLHPHNLIRGLSSNNLTQENILSFLRANLSGIKLDIKLSKLTKQHLQSKFGGNYQHKDANTTDNLEKVSSNKIVNRKHFILNNTINPVYYSDRCVIRVLMFMQRRMKRRIGKEEGTYYCPELDCYYEITYSTRYEALADKHIVILFLRTKWEWVDLHAARPSNQIWVMYARESPSYDHCIVPEDQWYNTSYNWTMTYHEDAHFSVPYGRYIVGVPTVSVADNRNWAKGKDKLSTWMASNCAIATYPRHELIQRLSNHIQIDSFGTCGNNTCPKTDPDECSKILSRYKFYFSLENAECDQYITEKLWRNAYINNMVPIVFGAPRKDYERLAPPNSFIYLGDFQSYRDLRDYLLQIDKNDSLYNTYFEWKKHGSIEQINFQTIFSDPSVCKLTAKYLEIRRKDPADVPDEMPDLQTWWKDTCQKNENITKLIRSTKN